MKPAYILLPLTLLFSCRKFVTIAPPQTALTGVTVFDNDASATGAVTGIYGRMMQSSSGFCDGSQGVSVLCGLAADELTDYAADPNRKAYYTNSLTPTNPINQGLWSELYSYIYAANAILEGLQRSTGTSALTKTQLHAEALFIRSFCFFYLSQLYGNVPLVTTTGYVANAHAPSASYTEVTARIIQDLKIAQTDLPELTGSGLRVRPTRIAATALLARVYLYQQDWANALIEASAVIAQSNVVALYSSLNQVFVGNGKEAIWQLQPVLGGYNTFDGDNFILPAAPNPSNALNSVALTSTFPNSFDTQDARKINWIGQRIAGTDTFYFPFKYKLRYNAGDAEPTEYQMVLRLAEQYLIRAEAAAQLQQQSIAVSDLNTIRNRAGLSNYTGSLQAGAIVSAVLQERRAELFCEWGHRWFDLKRSGLADNILSTLKGNDWQSSDTLFPIPQNELANDAALIQNPGY